MKRKKEKEAVLDMPGAFLIIVAGFLVSFGFIIFGLVSKKREEKVYDVEEAKIVITKDAEKQLGALFDDELSSGNLEFGDDIYSINDPFRQECASTAGDGFPAISGYTVCLR